MNSPINNSAGIVKNVKINVLLNDSINRSSNKLKQFSNDQLLPPLWPGVKLYRNACITGYTRTKITTTVMV